MMNDRTMSRAQAEAGEREWARQGSSIPAPAPDPTHDPGVILDPALPEGATRVARR